MNEKSAPLGVRGERIEHRHTLIADSLLRLVGRSAADEPEIRRIMARLSLALGAGHICLTVETVDSVSDAPSQEEDLIRITETDRQRLVDTGLVTVEPETPAPPTPLVMSKNRIYFQKMHYFETNTLRRLKELSRNVTDLDSGTLNADLAKFFPSDEDVDQREAARIGVSGRFAIITGGPGTGKTSTVVKILALYLRSNPGMRIALAAPTGKAALRLQESISSSREWMLGEEMIDEGLFRRIPMDVSTIHRLLKSRPHTPEFLHNRDNPLAVDLVVIDEASMIDLPLFSRLLDALPEGASLILIGDHFQLSSVEAGSVLGDLSQSALSDPRSSIRGNLAELTTSRRFGEESGIGIVSREIKRIAYGGADPSDLIAALNRGLKNVTFVTKDIERSFKRLVVEGFEPFFDAKDPAGMLEALLKFRVLSPHRRGRFGVDRINREIIEHLRSENRIQRRSGGDFFHGQAVQISVNDYGFHLFNGDTGVIFREQESGSLKACFRDYETHRGGGLRYLFPEILPVHELCYAITVHKSQGSEFDHVALILPDEVSPVMTAELIYTAVTRAKERFTIFSSEEVLKESIRRMIRRGSGIIDGLSGNGENQ